MKKLADSGTAGKLMATPELTNELKEASVVQNTLLPHAAPVCREIECTGHAVPSHYLSGDYYDFFYEEDKQKYWIFAGDVMGKGIPAFTKMAMLRTAIRTLVPYSESPADLLQKVNATLVEDFKLLQSFATLFVGMYDLETHVFTYGSAGHPPAILKSAGHPGEFLEGRGIAIGFLPDRTYPEFQVDLQPDDYIFVFTDGIIEAMNEKREQFGRERILELINQYSGDPTVIPVITNRVLNHCNYAQRDDITMLLLKRKKQLNGTLIEGR